MASIGTNTVKSGQAITPALADYSGTTTHTGDSQSHRIVVNAPGAIQLTAQQVNYPLAPVVLDTIRISTDTWHIRTKQRVPNPVGGFTNVKRALLFLQAKYPDGTIINNPSLDRRITAADTSITVLNRPGLMIGDRMPRAYGSSQTLEILPPGVPTVDNSVITNQVIQTATDEFTDVIDNAGSNLADQIDNANSNLADQSIDNADSNLTDQSNVTVFTTRNIAIAAGVVAIAGLAAWAYRRQHLGNANMAEWSPTGYDPTWWR